MRTLHKALAFVVREGDVELELLVFAHPHAGVQVPKGTVEEGERPEVTVRRELLEESGVREASIVRRFAALTREAPDDDADPGNAAPREPAVLAHVPPSGSRHVWHVFQLSPTAQLPDSWTHTAVGSEEEEGLDFSYFWVELANARRVLHPVFHPALDLVVRHLS